MNKNKFGKTIKMARVELDLTQTQLAKEVDLTQRLISFYERGKCLPSLTSFMRLKKALNKTADYFLE
jgi:putative transcriptional regulator